MDDDDVWHCTDGVCWRRAFIGGRRWQYHPLTGDTVALHLLGRGGEPMRAFVVDSATLARELVEQLDPMK